MATPVTWTRGPWRDRSPAATQPASPFGALTAPPNAGETEGEGSGYSTPRGEPAAIGTMTPGQRAAVGLGFGMPGGAISYGMRQAGMPGIAAGIASKIADAFSPSPAKPVGGLMLGIDQLASMLGVPEAVTNPYAGLLDPNEINDLRDYFGEFAAEEASRQRAETIASLENTEAPFGMMTSVGPSQGPSRGEPGGWAGQRSAPSPSVGNPDSPFGPSRETSGGGGGGNSSGEAGGPEGTDSSGPGTGGTGGGYAKGGVAKATRSPQRALFGEAGPETAMFVPKMMERPGMQGREREVMGEMRRTLPKLGTKKSKGTPKKKGFAKLRGKMMRKDED